MTERRLIKLRNRYVDASRQTLWRIRHQPDFPVGVMLNNSEYFYEDEVEAYEEANRAKPKAERAAQIAK